MNITPCITRSYGEQSQFVLFNIQDETLRMAVEFRSVHALYRGYARLVLSLMLDASAVFEDIYTLGQIIHEKVRRCVSRALIVA